MTTFVAVLSVVMYAVFFKVNFRVHPLAFVFLLYFGDLAWVAKLCNIIDWLVWLSPVTNLLSNVFFCFYSHSNSCVCQQNN